MRGAIILMSVLLAACTDAEKAGETGDSGALETTTTDTEATTTDPTETTDTTDTTDTTTSTMDDPSLEELLVSIFESADCSSETFSGAGVLDDTRLDFQTGCADGICPGMFYSEIVETLGEADSCSLFYFESDGFESRSLNCDWDIGISLSFWDDDLNGQPDELIPISAVGLELPWDGLSEDGLGLNVEIGCYFDVFGYPDSAEFESVDGTWFLSSINYQTPYFSVYDSSGGGSSGYDPDGVVERLFMAGL